MIIKNTTPYLGNLYLTFEKYPHYSGRTLLNKVHWNLGFTKLVSRITPHRDLDGFKVDPKKVELIEMFTDGMVGQHKFGPNNENTLENSFLTRDGKYIGSIKEGWWYYQNGMTVCDEYPHGVAIVWRTARNGRKTLLHGQDGVDGYYGYSHRGGSIFRIGDRIFDPEYVPKPHHYDDETWFKFTQEVIKKQEEYDREDWQEKVTIKDVMPFNLRGDKIIRNWGDALVAAINMSKYLS
jgi:hypothetical protein